ncbi:TPA: autotransporter domain-containing protein [Proteus mirabilis]
MPISFYKSKLLIISSIIITPLYSYSEYKIEKLTPSNHIDFNFNEYTRENIINFPSNEHRHGEMSFRTIPKVFSSKYKNVIIIYEENNIKISYNSGKDFHQFNIEEINYPVILSLSNDGRHAIGSGHKNGRNVFFIYDTYLKTSEILTPIDQDYYFTTQEGRYSLYSKDKEKESNDETQINKKEFFIYDNIKKITIPLNDIDNSELKNHKEKESFLIYSDLTLPQNTILKSPKILGSTLDNQYFYGLSTRKPEDTNKQNLYLDNIKVAFIYDPQNKKINFISNSEYGSSRINAISQNNIAVGWFEERKKFYHDERLFRRAYYYDIKKGTLSTLNYISDWNKYNHSEATDISANGELIVGWVSDKHESNLHTGSTTKRQAFVYQRNNKNAIFLTSLEKDKGSSEAYSISQDGHAIWGVSEDNNNQWHTVVWYLDKESNKVDQEKEKVDIFLNTILAKKDIKHAQDHLKEVEKKLSVVSANYNQSLSTLNNQLQEVTKKLNEAIENQDRIEKIIDDGDRDGDSEVWYKYSPLHQQYKDDVDNYETQKADLQQKISSLDNSPIGQELQVYRYEYQKNQQILTELQDDATVAEDKTTVEADKPIAEDKTTVQADKPIAEDKTTVEADKPIAEDKTTVQADKPIAEDKTTVEADKSIAEDKTTVQADKPIAEDKTTVEADKSIAEDKTTAEEGKPIADNNVQELPPQPTITVNTPINVRNTEQAIQLAAENGYKFIDMQQGQLRYLASATCSVGMEKACLSGFTHYQDIDKANAIQTGISGAYRFDINQTPLVVGLAIDSDSYSSLPKGYEYQGYPLPLIGFSVDVIPSLNPTSNSNALHLSLKGAYVNRKITIERPTLSNTEAGKGQARISGYYIDLQGYYPYALNSLITVTPFAGLTFNQTSRSAYSETQGAKFAAHYQALTAHSLLTKIGLGIEYVANAKLKLDTKAGLLWQLSHHQNDFQSHIDYIGQQKINYNENKKQLAQRPFASVGLTYQLDKQSSVNTTTNWQMTSYRNHDIHMGIAYTYRF